MEEGVREIELLAQPAARRSRHSLYPPIQLLITKSDPKPATHHMAPAPPLCSISKFRFQKHAQIGGGSLSQKAGNVLLPKLNTLNTVVGNCMLVLPSNFRLPFYCSSTAFCSLEQCLPPGLQITEISYRLLHLLYKCNDIRLDSPNYLPLDILRVKKPQNLCRPLTFA